MTDTPPQPKRRRRRWLVLGLVLLAVFVGWWYWPRNHGPLVGTWRTTINGVSSTMTFKANGMARTEVDGASFDYPYHIEGKLLTIGWDVAPMFSPAVQRFANMWAAITGRTHVIGVQVINFVEIGVDIIQVQRPASLANQLGPEVVEWKRSSE
jgi:hypothetical protein